MNPDLLTLGTGVFLGAVVQGLTGFAFTAIAAPFVLLVLAPRDAVALMILCSTVIQAVSMMRLRRLMRWSEAGVLVLGGAFTAPVAIWALSHVGAPQFRIVFGCFLLLYAAVMILRPQWAIRAAAGRPVYLALGAAGGLVGGMTGMPGAVPSMWCTSTGCGKDAQRGLVQPFILAMQLISLFVLWASGGLQNELALFPVLLPALAFGVAAGLVLFERANDAKFRTAVLFSLMAGAMAILIR